MGRMRSNWLIAATLTLGLLYACNASLFLDGAGQEAAPPTTKVRRDLLREINALERQLEETEQALAQARAGTDESEEQRVFPAEQAKTWPEAAAVLPADYAGNVDWVRALAEGAVVPWSGFDRHAPEQAVFDFDIRITGSADETNHLNFSHAAHTQWLTCKNCHPGIFPLGRDRAGPPPLITMTDIKAGRYCGECHGKVAFGVRGSCARCHDGPPHYADWQSAEEPRTPIEHARTWTEAERMLPVTEGGGDWSRALVEGIIDLRAGIDPAAPDQAFFPLDVERTPDAGPMFKVVFPHAAHTAVLSCATCHPSIFEMRAGANAISMATISSGDHCGRCHGTVAFAVPTGCPRCHAALAGS